MTAYVLSLRLESSLMVGKIRGERAFGCTAQIWQVDSRSYFDRVLGALRYTDKEPPQQKDPFWGVRDFMDAYRDNMTSNFTSGLYQCLEMNRCPLGHPSGRVPVGCLCRENHGLLAMNSKGVSCSGTF